MNVVYRGWAGALSTHLYMAATRLFAQGRIGHRRKGAEEMTVEDRNSRVTLLDERKRSTIPTLTLDVHQEYQGIHLTHFMPSHGMVPWLCQLGCRRCERIGRITNVKHENSNENGAQRGRGKS